MSNLEQSILKTIIYFDLFDFPLTKEELFRYLWLPPPVNYEEFCEVFGPHSLSLSPGEREVVTLSSRRGAGGEVGSVETKHGYYFLTGREEIVETRRRATVPTELKLKKARRAMKLIRSVPFLRAIFVCNSVGSDMAKPDSDIDFFIIAATKRIWIVRLFTNFILLIFGMRRHGKKITDRICLSFYVDADHLDLAPLRVANDDVHFAYWLHGMLPVYDPKNYFEKFLEANGWTKKYLPNIAGLMRMVANGSIPRLPLGHELEAEWGGVGVGWLGKQWKNLWEKMWSGAYGDIIEGQAESFQRMKMNHSGYGQKKNDKGVVVSDGVLKFHEQDTRALCRSRFLEKIRLIEMNHAQLSDCSTVINNITIEQ